ncbi:hypothetical protein ACSG0K_004336, partial [Escherichia coli]
FGGIRHKRFLYKTKIAALSAYADLMPRRDKRQNAGLKLYFLTFDQHLCSVVQFWCKRGS